MQFTDVSEDHIEMLIDKTLVMSEVLMKCIYVDSDTVRNALVGAFTVEPHCRTNRKQAIDIENASLTSLSVHNDRPERKM